MRVSVIRSTVPTFVLGTIVVASGCVERRAEHLAGEPCTDEPPTCGDWSFVYECHGGRWRPVSCADRCWAIAPELEASGCEMRIDGPDLCTCRYTDSNSLCKEEDLLRCVSSQALAACPPARERSCAEICAADETHPVSAGCDFDPALRGDRCWCTTEGAACTEPQWNQCFGEDVLVRCLEGTWTLTPCDDLCGARGVPCRFDATKNEAYCACEVASRAAPSGSSTDDPAGSEGR